MSLKSYLAFPVAGRFEQLMCALRNIKDIEILPSDQENVIIVVSDRPQEDLEQDLNQVESMQCLSLVFGHV